MGQLKSGIAGMFGSIKAGAAYAHGAITDPEARQKTKEDLTLALG